MSKVIAGRHTADFEGEIVIFMIGMRPNKPWKLRKWWPTFWSMFPMLRDLRSGRHPGMLHAYLAMGFGVGPMVVQYWRSVDDLGNYASDPDQRHLAMTRWFNREVGFDGDVGIWHETYVVRDGDHESVYGNMPLVGLAAATDQVDLGRRSVWTSFRRRQEAAER